MAVMLGSRNVGRDSDVYFAAEIGINHNGDIELAKQLIDVAADAGCDAVKFQKRTPDVCVPEHQKSKLRDTPWGEMTYLDYKHRIEFGKKEYDEIDAHCRQRGIDWFASCWDVASVDFISQYDVPAHKIASASVTDKPLLTRIAKEGKPVILSTGMSTPAEIDAAIAHFDRSRLVLCHSVSSYPAPTDELNLRLISVYLDRYPDLVIGYSGHEVILPTTYVAAALGATYIERHITLSRSMWGTDQASSIEPMAVRSLVSKIRTIRRAMGDGVKRVTDSERDVLAKLRRV